MERNDRLKVYCDLIHDYQVNGTNHEWDGICTRLWKHLKVITPADEYEKLENPQLFELFPELDYVKPKWATEYNYWFSNDAERITALKYMARIAGLFIPTKEERIDVYTEFLEMDDSKYDGGLCILLEIETAKINQHYKQNENSLMYFPEFYENKPADVDANGKWFQFHKQRRVYLRNLITLLKGEEPEILIL